MRDKGSCSALFIRAHGDERVPLSSAFIPEIIWGEEKVLLTHLPSFTETQEDSHGEDTISDFFSKPLSLIKLCDKSGAAYIFEVWEDRSFLNGTLKVDFH